MSQPHFWKSVRMTLTFPKWGLRSPQGLPKLQSSIVGVKTPCLEAFFMSLESYWIVDVEKWPCMSHLDICSISYGKNKGRESNWQFDSRPLKVKNRPNPSVCRWSATYRLKDLNESYKFALDFIQIRGLSKELWTHKVSRVQTGTISGLWDKKPFGCGCRGATQRILYGGRWWLPPSLGHGESCESRVARGLS